MVMEILANQDIKKWKLKFLKLLTDLRTHIPRNKYILSAILIIFSYYGLEYVILNEPAPFYLTGFIRIAMFKAIILYDWQKLKNERCLVKNIRQENLIGNKLSCTFCEAIQSIPETGNWNAQDIQDRYLSNHIPIIIKSAKKNNFSNTDDFIDKLMQNENLRETHLCELYSNIFLDRSFFPILIEKIRKLNSYFFHFQYCYFDAVKSFRSIIPRPSFMADNLHPAQYLWILSSKNYIVTKLKYLQLSERYTAFMQLFGSNVVQLKPLNNCVEDCPVLEIVLSQHETLFFTNLWQVEYIPGNDSENLAVLFETH